MNAPNPATQRNRGVLKAALIVCACAFLFGFAMVPIYRIACEHVFGIKLAQGAASEAKVSGYTEDTSRTVRVQFVASVNSKLPWAFQSEAPSVEVHPGKLTEAWFDATNHSKEAIVGNAVPSVAPSTASGAPNAWINLRRVRSPTPSIAWSASQKVKDASSMITLDHRLGIRFNGRRVR